MSSAAIRSFETFETLIPARLDRLPWSRFHWLLVIGLGITWVLDGLEVTLVGAISAVLQRPDVLHFTAAEIGFDQFGLSGGRGDRITGLWPSDRSFRAARVLFCQPRGLSDRRGPDRVLMEPAELRAVPLYHRAGIGGEYSAVNSAIDELIPARLRGRD